MYQFLKVIVKEIVIDHMSLFPNEGILTKEEIESQKCLAANLHVYNRELFRNILNNCYKYATAAIKAKGQGYPNFEI